MRFVFEDLGWCTASVRSCVLLVVHLHTLKNQIKMKARVGIHSGLGWVHYSLRREKEIIRGTRSEKW